MIRLLYFIEKLATDTKNGILDWDRYLHIYDNNDINQMINHYVNNIPMNDSDLRMQQEESYYVQNKGGLVFFFNILDQFNNRTHIILAVQKEDTSKVKPLLSKNEFQGELMRLQYLIEESIDDSDEFLDSILED